MPQGINLTAAMVADFAGVLLLLLLLLAKGWQLPGRKKESRILLILLLASLFDNLIDPFVFSFDGKPGRLNFYIVYFGNSFLYLYNLVVGTGVLALIVRHIKQKISKFQYITTWILTLIETVLLIINFYTPIVFSVDENNVYRRGPLYFVYIAAAVVLLTYGLTVYVQARRKVGIKYFPVWEFILPIVCGVTVQTLFYGISTQPVCFALAFCSIVVNLQKEYLYIDKLTGVYNRYELEKLIDYYTGRRKKQFVAIMLDLNGFKFINDNYTHKEGDEALRTVADILTEVSENEGDVIRFAGDEFILILHTFGEDAVEDYRERINAALDGYNETSGKPYKISAAIGGAPFDVENGYDFIDKIDRLMYQDKKAFYQNHERRERRHPGEE
ncbi:MAG: GGDEF domain-containing protein [Lachnospiraceae bacterium]|nr:GGDEF domain-containing protein [Lachnospiraceae bacterium]